MKPQEMELTPPKILNATLLTFLAFGSGVFIRLYYLKNPIRITTPTNLQTPDPIPAYAIPKTSNVNEGECENVQECDNDVDEHFPAGQHLLLDIKNVTADFLNSDVGLVEALMKVVKESKLELLSYHCYNLHASGLSCVSNLLDSHISINTWPAERVSFH